MKFKLVAGQYVDGPPGHDIVYDPGDVIDTDIDLATRFNQPNSTKFERVVDKTPASPGRAMPPVVRPEEAAFRPNPAARPAAAAAASVAAAAQAASSVTGPAAGGGTATATMGVDTLDAMSVKDLISHAQAEEIDLKGAKTKEEILKVIRATIGRGF